MKLICIIIASVVWSSVVWGQTPKPPQPTAAKEVVLVFSPAGLFAERYYATNQTPGYRDTYSHITIGGTAQVEVRSMTGLGQRQLVIKLDPLEGHPITSMLVTCVHMASQVATSERTSTRRFRIHVTSPNAFVIPSTGELKIDVSKISSIYCSVIN